jgi:hypothetical protein
MPKIKFKRGSKENLPNLDEGEPGFAKDTEEVFIGTGTGNVQLAKQDDVDSVKEEVSQTNKRFDDLKLVDMNAEILDARGGEFTLGERLDKSSAILDGVTTSLPTKANKTDVKFVTYEMFGAKLDGVTDDTIVIKACHDYANANNLKVVQNSGFIFITDTVTVQTDTDLTGCTMLIKSGCENKTLYKITSKIAPVTVSSFTQSELTKKARVIPSLASYKHYFVTISSNELLCVRLNNGTTNVYKKESVILNRGGVSTTSLINDYTTGALTITAHPFESKRLDFGGFDLSYNFNDFTKGCTAVWVERSNHRIHDVKMTIPNTVDYDDSTQATGTYKTELIRIQNCCKSLFENVSGENISQGAHTTGYIISYTNVVGIKIIDCDLLKGWGILQSEMAKDWVVRDSIVNRIDVHHTGGDMYINNTKFLGGWGVFLGYGVGRVILDSCVHDMLDGIDAQTNNSIVTCGTTYGLVYEGEIIVKKPKMIVRGSTASILNISYDLAQGDNQIAYDIKLPSLKSDVVNVENTTTNTVISGYYLYSLNGLYNSLNGKTKKIYMPDYIDIQGVKIKNKADGVVFKAVRINEQIASIGSYMYGKVAITLRDIKQDVYSKFINGFTLAEIQADIFPKNLVEIIDLVSNPSNLTYTIDIDNCDGGLRSECSTDYISTRNSALSTVKVESYNGANTFICKRFISNNCTFYFSTGFSYDRSFVFKSNLEWYNNKLNLIKIDGVYKYVFPYSNSGQVEKILLGNIFAQTDAAQADADKYWKYVNAVFKVPTTL